MDIPLVYLSLSLFMLAFGLDILFRKRGGIYVWKPPFGYKVGWYISKPALVIGIIATAIGAIFSIDALRFVITGQKSILFQATFCTACVLLLIGINIFARKYVVTPKE